MRGPATVFVDKEKIRQVITNLLENSIKIWQRNGTSLPVCTNRRQNNILVEISDDGIGISENIFPAYSNASIALRKVAARDITGSGLGLANLQAYQLSTWSNYTCTQHENIVTTIGLHLRQGGINSNNSFGIFQHCTCYRGIVIVIFGKQKAALPSRLRIKEYETASFFDLFIIAVYMLAMVLTGLWFSGKSKNCDQFTKLPGISGMGYWISIYATFLSSNTFLGVPGNHLAVTGMLLSSVFDATIRMDICKIFYSFYRQSGEISAYITSGTPVRAWHALMR